MTRNIFQSLTTATAGKLSRVQRPASNYSPAAGDVALFELCDHAAPVLMQDAAGKPHLLQPGQRFVGVLGSVYGPDDREGYVPESIDQPMHLLHASGIVGAAADHCLTSGGELPSVRLLSLVLGENGAVHNTAACAISPAVVRSTVDASSIAPEALQGRIIVVGGTDALAGTRGLAEAISLTLKNRGYQVARLRLNGSGPDASWKQQAQTSADTCLSFEDLGLPGTYLLSAETLSSALAELLARSEQQRPDWVIVELEQNLLQRESDLFLNQPTWKSLIAGVALAASSPIAALGGLHVLQNAGHHALLVGGSMLDQVLMRSEFEVFSDVPMATPAALRKILLPLLSVQLRNDWDAYVLAAS